MLNFLLSSKVFGVPIKNQPSQPLLSRSSPLLTSPPIASTLKPLLSSSVPPSEPMRVDKTTPSISAPELRPGLNSEVALLMLPCLNFVFRLHNQRVAL